MRSARGILRDTWGTVSSIRHSIGACPISPLPRWRMKRITSVSMRASVARSSTSKLQRCALPLATCSPMRATATVAANNSTMLSTLSVHWYCSSRVVEHLQSKKSKRCMPRFAGSSILLRSNSGSKLYSWPMKTQWASNVSPVRCTVWVPPIRRSNGHSEHS